MNGIAKALQEGRLIRGSFVKRRGGQLYVCPLAALMGIEPVHDNVHPLFEYIPQSVAPRWIAELIPAWADCGTKRNWHDLMVRLAALASKFSNLEETCSRVAEAHCQLVCLQLLLEYGNHDFSRLVRCWRQVARGQEPVSDKWSQAYDQVGALLGSHQTKQRIFSVTSCMRLAIDLSVYNLTGEQRTRVKQVTADRIIKAHFDELEEVFARFQV